MSLKNKFKLKSRDLISLQFLKSIMPLLTRWHGFLEKDSPIPSAHTTLPSLKYFWIIAFLKQQACWESSSVQQCPFPVTQKTFWMLCSGCSVSLTTLKTGLQTQDTSEISQFWVWRDWREPLSFVHVFIWLSMRTSTWTFADLANHYQFLGA